MLKIEFLIQRRKNKQKITWGKQLKSCAQIEVIVKLKRENVKVPVATPKITSEDKRKLPVLALR